MTTLIYAPAALLADAEALAARLRAEGRRPVGVRDVAALALLGTAPAERAEHLVALGAETAAGLAAHYPGQPVMSGGPTGPDLAPMPAPAPNKTPRRRPAPAAG